MSEYRTGRKVGRTIYRDDVLIGIMDTPELAEQFVRTANLCSGSIHWANGQERIAALESQLQAAKDDHGESTEHYRKLYSQCSKDFLELRQQLAARDDEKREYLDMLSEMNSKRQDAEFNLADARRQLEERQGSELLHQGCLVIEEKLIQQNAALVKPLKPLALEIECIAAGEFGSDWADSYPVLYRYIEQAKEALAEIEKVKP